MKNQKNKHTNKRSSPKAKRGNAQSRKGSKTLGTRRPTNTGTQTGRAQGVRKSEPKETKVQPTFRTANLFLYEVSCLKTTRELLKKDEIVITAIKTQGKVEEKHGKRQVLSKSQRGKTISVGKFKKGDKRKFRTPELLASISLGSNSQPWPRNYLATVIPTEKDKKGLGKIVNKVIDAIDKKASESLSKVISGAATAAASTVLTAAGAGAVAGNVVPLIGPVVVGAVSAGVAAAFVAIKKASEDDVFTPQKVSLKLAKRPEREGLVSGSKKTLTFKDFGSHYKVTIGWEIK